MLWPVYLFGCGWNSPPDRFVKAATGTILVYNYSTIARRISMFEVNITHFLQEAQIFARLPTFTVIIHPGTPLEALAKKGDPTAQECVLPFVFSGESFSCAGLRCFGWFVQPHLQRLETSLELVASCWETVVPSRVLTTVHPLD